MSLQFNPFTGTFDVTTKGDTGAVAAAGDGSAAAPGITFASDTNTGIYRPGADQLALSTNGTGRLFIDASGNVAIGNSSANNKFLLYTVGVNDSYFQVANGSTGLAATQGLRIGTPAAGNANIVTDGLLTFGTGNTERLRITSSGQLLVGTASSRQVWQVNPNIQVESAATYTHLSLVANSINAGYSPVITLARTRGTTVGGTTAVQQDDSLGTIGFAGAQNSAIDALAASITCAVDSEVGTAGDTTDVSGRLVFSTTADGASFSTERMRITNDGVRGYNQPAPVAVDATATLTVANLKTGIITSTTAAAVTMTLPTGTPTEGGFSGLYTNFTFEWTVINTGATNAVTVQGNTDHTLVGSGTVAAGVSGRFASRRTAANTFVTYRLS